MKVNFAENSFYTAISCLGGVFAKKIPVEIRKISRAERRGKFSLKTGIVRKYSP